jgi:hypothetical protein
MSYPRPNARMRRLARLEAEMRRLSRVMGIPVNRLCGGKLCCQATTLNGSKCLRQAVLVDRIFDQRHGCCLFCWQHLAMFKAGELVTEVNIDKVIRSIMFKFLPPDLGNTIKTEYMLNNFR